MTGHNQTPPAAAGTPTPYAYDRTSASGRRAASLLASILLAVAAQYAIVSELPRWGIGLYLLAAGAVVAGVVPWPRYQPPERHTPRPLDPSYRLIFGLVALACGASTYMLSGDNRYHVGNVTLWLLSIGFWWAAWADFRPGQWWLAPPQALRRGWHTLRTAYLPLLALLVVLTVGAFFRFYELSTIPYDISRVDHVPKLHDVHDILSAEVPPHIFFIRNTGREPWQFYWTAWLIELFDLPLSFITLRVGTALIGLLTLPAIFLLGREAFDTRIALLATLFAAVSSWAVLMSRFGLRYPLTPCAMAWTMALLVYGLRHGSRNAMLGAGLWVGIGLQGYTSYRFVPLVLLLVGGGWLLWYLAQRRWYLARRTCADGFAAAGMAVLVVMPLARYAIDHPDQFFFRAVTRVTSLETPIQGEPLAIFANNVRRVLLAFNYTVDEVWVVSLPWKPMLDPVLGALLVIGAVAVLVQGVRRHNPWPAIILGAGILMLLPSALSIAFPRENPSTVRVGGAQPMLFLVCATVPGLLLEAAWNARYRLARVGAVLAVTALCGVVVYLNVNRIFVQYPLTYCERVLPERDMANEMAEFLADGHRREDAWIVEYQNWWWVYPDTLAIWTGEMMNFPGRVMGTDELATVDLEGRPGWFLAHPDDLDALNLLHRRYPQGRAEVIVPSQCPYMLDLRFVVFTTQPTEPAD